MLITVRNVQTHSVVDSTNSICLGLLNYCDMENSHSGAVDQQATNNDEDAVENIVDCGELQPLQQDTMLPTCHTWTPSSDLNEKDWEAGILLMLRQKYFLPFDALIVVSNAIHDFYERRIVVIQVGPTMLLYSR